MVCRVHAIKRCSLLTHPLQVLNQINSFSQLWIYSRVFYFSTHLHVHFSDEKST